MLTIVSSLVPGPPRPGIERPLVERDEQDRVVAAHDRLGAVAVMDVPVDDRDALDPELGLRVARRDDGVAEDAEAHRAGRASAWWPGGRTSANPPTSTARIEQPAASRAASQVVGWPIVSPSSQHSSESAAMRAT